MKVFGRTNLLLVLAVIILAVAPLALGLGRGKAQPFAGADSLAEKQISTDHPDYKPWARALYQPPSAEVESALFALQASLGAGFIGYYLGAARTRRKLSATVRATPAGHVPSGDASTADG